MQRSSSTTFSEQQVISKAVTAIPPQIYFLIHVFSIVSEN